jgi:hypothetical protein
MAQIRAEDSRSAARALYEERKRWDKQRKRRKRKELNASMQRQMQELTALTDKIRTFLVGWQKMADVGVLLAKNARELTAECERMKGECRRLDRASREMDKDDDRSTD